MCNVTHRLPMQIDLTSSPLACENAVLIPDEIHDSDAHADKNWIP